MIHWLLVLEEYMSTLINIPSHENIIDDTIRREKCIETLDIEVIVKEKKNYYNLTIMTFIWEQ